MNTRGTIRVCLLTAALLLAAQERADGRGCLARDTPILTPHGPVPVQDLAVGDAVWSVNGSGLCRSVVTARFQVIADLVLEVQVADRVLRVTPEHPLETSPGVFNEAATLRAGDLLWVWQGGKLSATPVVAIRNIIIRQPAYNLMVSPGGTYLANGIAVHNKGCFLPDTPIQKADGTQAPIRAIRVGDRLAAFTPEGDRTIAIVQDVLTHEVDEFCRVTTDHLTLCVTAEHPFFVGDGCFKTLAALKIGDTLYACDGPHLCRQRILAIERVAEHVTVYNLQTDEPHTFFAHGIAVHNKGCFAAGTPVQTPGGPVPIERLRLGDRVICVAPGGQLSQTSVEAVYESRSDVLNIRAGAVDLLTTVEHPLMLANGGFACAGDLSVGDQVILYSENRLRKESISRITPGPEQPVYNLGVGGSHTFIAGGFVVHNKGGCFPPGTRITTPTGDVPIESLVSGQKVLAIEADGRAEFVPVLTTFRSRAKLQILHTDRGTIRTTADHPIAVGPGEFRRAGELCPGDAVLAWIGGQIITAKILNSQMPQAESVVFNLEVDEPHTFVADGFIVHNKGGHGGSGHSGFGGHSGTGSRSHGSSTSPANDQSSFGDRTFDFLLIGFCSIIAFVSLFGSFFKFKRTAASEDLDFVYSQSETAGRTERTTKLLQGLAVQDPSVDPAALAELAKSTFVKLQHCWDARAFEPMQPLLMPDLYRTHLAQLKAMVRQHEINHIVDLTVERVDLVHVRYTQPPGQREFTALITASACDFYTDDRTNSFIRGDHAPARFQEFWIFHYLNGRWLLREIEQSRESHALRESNFVEGAAAEIEPEAGPAAAPGSDDAVWNKATRIDALLQRLGARDLMWDRELMSSQARDVFVRVMLAEEAGAVSDETAVDLLPEALESLRARIAARLRSGETVEYRNLCVRKVDLVLVRSFASREQNEFTARVSAHAQTIITRGTSILHRDEYEMPFVQFLTFGMSGSRWKLKDVLPPAEGARVLAAENVVAPLL